MKAIIIEDEKLIARELENKIRQVDATIQITELLSSVKTATRWFMQNPEPDIIFADIQLSDGVSFEIFERFTLSCPIIFTTAYDEYALQAFKANGVDYLLKPIDTDDLKRAIEKVKQLKQTVKLPTNLHELLEAFQQPESRKVYKEKFIVSIRNTWIPVQTNDIACFVRDNLNYIYTFSGDRYMADFTSLDELEDILNPKQFYRANRQCIVNIGAIQTMKLHANQKITLTLKKPLIMEQDISREKAPGFKKWFEQ